MPPENDTKNDGEKKNEGGADEKKDAPKYLTAEDVNKAITGHLKRNEERFTKALEERLAKLFPKKEETDEDDDDGTDATEKPGAKGKPDQSGGQASSADAQTAARLKKLEKANAALLKQAEDEKKAREEQAAKIARDEERAKLGDGLSALGVDPKRAKAAIALLYTEDKRVRRNAEGKIVFVDDDGEEQDLAAGLKAWAASDEGKLFMPAKGAQGSGESGGGKPPGAPRSKPTKQSAAEQLAAAVFGITPRG